MDRPHSPSNDHGKNVDVDALAARRAASDSYIELAP
jgi:hypothetical protein